MPKKERLLKRLLRSIGPGFITGASDDDPSGIGTYAQTGAQFGYGQLWTALFSIPFMIAIQEMCGRIGLVTGSGLAGVIRKHYGRKLLIFAVTLLLVANTINIGADLGAMAAAAELVVPVPFATLIIFMTIATLLLEVFVSYKLYASFLKYLTLSLFAYVIVAFVVRQPWLEIVKSTIVPHVSLSKDYVLNIVALLGTTISPYLFFWQADEEVEEEIAEGRLKVMGKGKPRFTAGNIRTMRLDTASGMIFSNIIMFFIIVTSASTLHANGILSIATAVDAAKALEPLGGKVAFFLFAIGVIGTGLLAVPVLAGSASYAMAEAFGWKEGLYRKFNQAHGFYGVITIATLAGLLVNFTHVPPFTMLYYTAVLNGFIAPPLMVVILLIGNNKKILGKHVNSRTSNVLGWIITSIMGAGAVALVLWH